MQHWDPDFPPQWAAEVISPDEWHQLVLAKHQEMVDECRRQKWEPSGDPGLALGTYSAVTELIKRFPGLYPGS